MKDRPNPRDSKEIYDAQVEQFASQAPALLSFEYIGKPTIEKFLAEYVSRHFAEAKALDVGSATGRIVNLIIKGGVTPSNITGVEISPKEVKNARSILPEVNFILGNITDVRLHPNSFNVCTSYMVFEFLDNVALKRAFKNIFGSLAHRGILIYGTTHPARWSAKYGVAEEGWFSTGGPWGSSYDASGNWVTQDEFDNWFRPVERFIELTEKAGFKIDKVEELYMPLEVAKQHPEHKTYNAPERLFIVAHKP